MKRFISWSLLATVLAPFLVITPAHAGKKCDYYYTRTRQTPRGVYREKECYKEDNGLSTGEWIGVGVVGGLLLLDALSSDNNSEHNDSQYYHDRHLRAIPYQGHHNPQPVDYYHRQPVYQQRNSIPENCAYINNSQVVCNVR